MTSSLIIHRWSCSPRRLSATNMLNHPNSPPFPNVFCQMGILRSRQAWMKAEDHVSDFIHKPCCKINSRAGEKLFRSQQQSSAAIWVPSAPAHLLSPPSARGVQPVQPEHRCFNRIVLFQRGEKTALTMIIPSLPMYSHPSIKDTLPQRSVIASHRQLWP